MSIIEIKINLDHLLWRTRSKDQDYQFIKTPKSPSLDGWFSFFSKVFSNHEPSRNPKNILGKHESFWFVATCFIDDKYLDSGGRPIKQYLIWFLHGEYDIPKIKDSLANDWGKDFMSASEELYKPFYESSDTSKLDKENCIIIERSSDKFKKLQYSDIGEIKCELSAPSLDHKTKKEVKETFEEAIRRAVEEGEALASAEYNTCSVPFYRSYKLHRIPKEIIKSDKERERFLLCLAKSFGGSPKDQFVKVRAKNIKSIAFKFIGKPQKGFDSIVNVFEKYNKHEKLINLDESEGKKFVSECIKGGASADDVCIRNIYLRLRELAKQDKRE
ncbi:MAG: hypothetical protein L6Q53_12675 [Candidatus Brocadia sinica]|nr:hypothetical protein [Candidatus Brocadia sinica]NUO07013.1 hypothetical protein [Candidatus Brocadia sinica]